MSEEMTREQACYTLRNAAWLGTNKDRERIERAVELLCGEPCEDAISRQAAITALKKHFSDDDSIDTECGAYWHHGHVIDVLQGMPSVTPKQRTGHWIYTGWVCQTDEILYGYACSECGGISFFRKYDNKILGGKWCHCCGADMRESEEQA